MNRIVEILSPEIVYSLGMMLLHMLWQGLVIAITLGFFLIIMRKSSARSRYVISVFSLFLLPIGALITFIGSYRNIILQNELPHAFKTFEAVQSQGAEGILHSFIELYSRYLPIIVFIWFTGVTFLLLRYFGLLIYVERLKNYMAHPVSSDIIEKVRKLCEIYGVRKKIRSFVSERVTSPMIIGHANPVLLIPVMALEKLSPEEMDLVLQHELAHVKRNDYLVNVFQHIIEILFFFHPATWWISSMVRKEREECCDTYAARGHEEKIVLARALTTIHEINTKIPNMALTFLNRKNGLFNRISNLFGKSGIATFKEGILVTVFFFSSIGLMSFIVGGNHAGGGEKVITTLNTELDDGRHLFAKIDSSGNIEKLFVEGKRISPRKAMRYQQVIDSLLTVENRLDYELGHEEKVIKENPNNTKVERTRDYNMENLEEAITREVEAEIKKEIEAEIKKEMIHELNENYGFNLDVDDDGSKVKMNAGENGFYMDIDDGNDKVRMEFGKNGMYMKVQENGKTVVHMDFGAQGVTFKVNDKDSVKSVKWDGK